MAEAAIRDTAASDAVAAYTRMLASIIEKRPSGTRQRLATALAKNRSFVSQITNPAYATPIPASHLDVIFEVCHFSAAERRDFTRLYSAAHPKKLIGDQPSRGLTAVQLPDLGDDERNRRLHGLVSGFVRQIVKLIDEDNGKGKRR
jgi:hypothetical protein